MRSASVTVCEDFQGNLTLLCKGKPLSYETWKRKKAPLTIKDSKEINQAVDQAGRLSARHGNLPLTLPGDN